MISLVAVLAVKMNYSKIFFGDFQENSRYLPFKVLLSYFFFLMKASHILRPLKSPKVKETYSTLLKGANNVFLELGLE